MTRARITHIEAIKVGEWVEANKERISERSGAEVTRLIKDELGITAHAKLVLDIMRAKGIATAPPPKPKRVPRNGSVQLLNQRPTRHHIILARSVEHLYLSLGMAVPEGIKDILAHRKMKEE